MCEYRCHFCGSTNVERNYNYDTAYLDFECKDCGETYNETILIYCDRCDCQIPQDEVENLNGDVLCEECYELRKAIFNY